MTGLIITDEEVFCLYHFGRWKLSWLSTNETSQSHSIGISLGSLCRKYGRTYKIPNSIIFIHQMRMIEDIVKGGGGGNGG